MAREGAEGDGRSPMGCPGCLAKTRGEVGVNHSEECRRRIEERMRAGDPERCTRTLGRLAEGTLKEGTLKRDKRKTKGIEVRNKIKQKEDKKEARKEEVRRKSAAVSQGECMDTEVGQWICPKWKTRNEDLHGMRGSQSKKKPRGARFRKRRTSCLKEEDRRRGEGE